MAKTESSIVARIERPRIERPSARALAASDVTPLVSADRNDYGIEQAMSLLESLPQGRNQTLVLEVVKKTLQSMNVELDEIVSDAQRKENGLEKRIQELNNQIAEFEALVKGKRRQVEGLKRERVQLARVRTLLKPEARGEKRSPKASPVAVIAPAAPASPSSMTRFLSWLHSLVGPKPAAPTQPLLTDSEHSRTSQNSLPKTSEPEVAAHAATSGPSTPELPDKTPTHERLAA